MQGVSVDDDFARFGEKSYAINKITSVEVRERRANTGCLSVVYGLAALLSVLITIAGLLPFVLVAGLFGWLTYRELKKARAIEYQLFVITTATEAQAFTSRDKGEVIALRERIEKAMMSQGGRS